MRSVAALMLAALSIGWGTAIASPVFEYVHVEANEGAASGGHVAIRLGDVAYHFQHEPPGVLHLQRDDWNHFRYAYGALENRTMHASRVDVTDADYERLRRRFAERYLAEQKVFAERDVLRDDRRVLALLLARRRGATDGALRVRGAGFFFPAGDARPSPAALDLRDRIGAERVARRAADIERQLAELAPVPQDPPSLDDPVAAYPQFPYAFSSRYRDLLAGLVALRALDRGLAIRAGSYWSPGDALDDGERRALAAWAERLPDQLGRLFDSTRPDWGFAFLAVLARLEALELSATTGRLVLLDAFPPGSETVPRSYLHRHRDAVLDVRAQAADELARARDRLRTAAAVDEATFADVEIAGNRLMELDAAVRDDRDLRAPSAPLVPSRDAPWTELPLPGVTPEDVARARVAEERFAEDLERRYGYDLIRRNCVSELLRTADASGAVPARPTDLLDFIPFVSARDVNAAWNVTERTALASYRRERLDEMYRREDALRVRLRESNVFTSTVYRPNADDSVFVLFTDDAGVLRPAFGAVNLAAGLGAVAAGIPLLPFDHGRTLWAGTRGVVFSVPELAFVSLRKGSFDRVPRERRPVER